MSEKPASKINWHNATTVLCAAILVGTEVFIAAVAGGWAVAGLLGLGQIGMVVLIVAGLVLASMALTSFLRAAVKVEPIIDKG